MQETTLLNAKIGKKMVIDTITSDPKTELKLVSLGILPGDTLEVTGRALMGGPISIEHNNQLSFALRKEQAAHVKVKILQ